MKRKPVKKVAPDLWSNPEWLTWFNARPPKIQALIRRCPPNQQYRVQGGSFPGCIYSYDEEKGGGVSMKVNIDSPFMPRTVFGLKPKDLKVWTHEDAKASEAVLAPMPPLENVETHIDKKTGKVTVIGNFRLPERRCCAVLTDIAANTKG